MKLLVRCIIHAVAGAGWDWHPYLVVFKDVFCRLFQWANLRQPKTIKMIYIKQTKVVAVKRDKESGWYCPQIQCTCSNCFSMCSLTFVSDVKCLYAVSVIGDVMQLMTNGEDVGGELRKAPVRNSSSPSSKPHRAALSAARSLMELWLPAWIDHRAIRLKNSQFQQIRPQTVVYVWTDADWRSIMPGCVRPAELWWWC